uniref:Uncharacterized protein n=1 Tax=Brassica oleracea var. oleracea TaxID=109376 RepID=A0A0D3AT02_BRAOL
MNVTKFSGSVPKNLFFDFSSYIQDEDLMFCFESKNSFRIAFSQWKNLKTLIINDNYLTGRFEFHAVGENCTNLTNLKYLGVLLLITGLQNFETLNISHSKVLDMIPDRREVVTMDNIVQAVTEKRLKFICYSVNNCAVCKSRPRFDTFWSYVSKHWRDDEIKEFQF